MDDARAHSGLVVGLGELLWDVFPGGEIRLGGAPANFAYHARTLGHRTAMITRVGRDHLGDAAIAALAAAGVDTSFIQRDAVLRTGTATVAPSGDEASFVIDVEAAAWSALEWNVRLSRLCGEADALVFGTLLQATAAGRAALSEAARALPERALSVLDLNLRPPHDRREQVEAALAAANVVKLNAAELAQLARSDGGGGGGEDALVDRLINERGMDLVVVTRGALGCRILSREGVIDRAAFPLDPDRPANADSVGAGDAFTAGLISSLLRGKSHDDAASAACRYAAFVASRPGAMPAVPQQLIQEVTTR